MPTLRKSLRWNYSKLGMDTRLPAITPEVEGFSDCYNGYFTINGSYKTRPGSSNFHNEIATTRYADGLVDFWYQNASQYTLMVVNGLFYYSTGGASWTNLAWPGGATYTAGTPVNFAILNDMVVMGNGTDHNMYFQGSDHTLHDLNAQLSPCKYFLTHGPRMYAAGNPNDPSVVYWSAGLNPTDWTTTNDSGFAYVEKGRDVILGLGSYLDDVWIFKGDVSGSIHVLSGTTYQTYAMVCKFRNMHGHHRSIINVGNDLLFMSEDGIYSINALISSGGQAVQSRISDPISLVFNASTDPQLELGCAVFVHGLSIACFIVPINGTNLNRVMAVSPPISQGAGYRWSYWDIPKCSYVTLWRNSSLNNSLIMLAGGIDTSTTNCRPFYFDGSITTDIGNASIPCSISTQYLSMGNDLIQKCSRNAAIVYLSVNSLNLRVDTVGGKNYTKSISVPSTSLWGSVTWGGFTWTSAVSGVATAPMKGCGTALKYTISNTSGPYDLYSTQIDVTTGAYKAQVA